MVSDRKLDLARLAFLAGGECIREHFSAMQLSFCNGCTVLLFGASMYPVVAGERVCSGAQSSCAVLATLYTLLWAIISAGYKNAALLDIRIQNRAFCLKVPWRVDILSMSREFHLHTQYRPQIFPGLTYRPAYARKHNVVFTVYRTGTVIVAGAKSYRDIAAVRDRIVEDLARFRA